MMARASLRTGARPSDPMKEPRLPECRLTESSVLKPAVDEPEPRGVGDEVDLSLNACLACRIRKPAGAASERQDAADADPGSVRYEHPDARRSQHVAICGRE